MAVVADAWNWLTELVLSSLNDVVVAAIVLFVGLALARILALSIDAGLRRIRLNEALRSGFGIPFNVSGIIGQLILWSISAITVLWALRIIGLNRIVLTILAVIALVIIVFSMVLALRDLVPNLVAGAEMHRKGFFAEGDTVMIDGETAQVLETGLLETILEQEDVRIVIPNALMLRKEIVVQGASSPVSPEDHIEQEEKIDKL